MPHNVKKYLLDILNVISEIESFIEPTGNDFDAYCSNNMLKKAIEREFEIIGEALRKALEIDKTLEITHSKSIIGLRNHIIHSYDNVVDEIIWGIIQRHLPNLKQEIEEQLNS